MAGAPVWMRLAALWQLPIRAALVVTQLVLQAACECAPVIEDQAYHQAVVDACGRKGRLVKVFFAIGFIAGRAKHEGFTFPKAFFCTLRRWRRQHERHGALPDFGEVSFDYLFEEDVRSHLADGSSLGGSGFSADEVQSMMAEERSKWQASQDKWHNEEMDAIVVASTKQFNS